MQKMKKMVGFGKICGGGGEDFWVGNLKIWAGKLRGRKLEKKWRGWEKRDEFRSLKQMYMVLININAD